ncbi:acyl-CoA carboxylase subunit epsilon [uncultured Serinicoccus sp.]|uniref:acyl-CoA carboxylase subunit epsilon n=1 Tax=uncultured Serinicoccus sp. TaxID=735514 RepID=UPI00260AB1B1|nr:acyl-CoA carboxylase subunit epsilon [uncultured Serinicoccus sp.]
MSDTPGTPEAQQPALVRVVRGAPTPAQLAALTVVLSAAAGGSSNDTTPDRPGAPRTLWTARARFARPRPSVGPDGWRASALPR